MPVTYSPPALLTGPYYNFLSNEPVESGSVFTAKDEMLMRGIGMQDAPLFSTQWNNEELLKKNAIIFTYVDSMTIRVKENWKTDDLFRVAPSGLSLIFFKKLLV